MAERLFAPAVKFYGARVPVEQLAEHLKVYVQEWLPDGQPHKTTWDLDDECLVVYFPMTAAEFVSWGCMLLEELHETCDHGSEDDASEFLHCFADYAPGGRVGDCEADSGPPPARMMIATLYISDDTGATWVDRQNLKLRR